MRGNWLNLLRKLELEDRVLAARRRREQEDAEEDRIEALEQARLQAEEEERVRAEEERLKVNEVYSRGHWVLVICRLSSLFLAYSEFMIIWSFFNACRPVCMKEEEEARIKAEEEAKRAAAEARRKKKEEAKNKKKWWTI